MVVEVSAALEDRLGTQMGTRGIDDGHKNPLLKRTIIFGARSSLKEIRVGEGLTIPPFQGAFCAHTGRQKRIKPDSLTLIMDPVMSRLGCVKELECESPKRAALREAVGRLIRAQTFGSLLCGFESSLCHSGSTYLTSLSFPISKMVLGNAMSTELLTGLTQMKYLKNLAFYAYNC